MLRLLEEKIATPLGPLWVICDEQFRLRAVEWEEYSERMVQLLDAWCSCWTSINAKKAISAFLPPTQSD